LASALSLDNLSTFSSMDILPALIKPRIDPVTAQA